MTRELRDLAAEGDMVICMGAGDITEWAGRSRGRRYGREGPRNERPSRPCHSARQADAQRAARAARLVQEWRQCRMAVRAEGREDVRRVPSRSSKPRCRSSARGLGSNLIVRDGGVPGVVVRLGKPFARIEQLDETRWCGGGASGMLVSSTARDHGIAGLEFLRGIPRNGRRVRANERGRLWP